LVTLLIITRFVHVCGYGKKGCKPSFKRTIFNFETIRVGQNLWKTPLVSVENS
jgi:hypothetical protein